MSAGRANLEIGAASENAISDFDNEVPIHPETNSKIPLQQRTFNTFDEADAAAEAEK